ncbi:hypothetical protein E2C01_011017 [Portunus trituberculatus]|uniref:HTH psq-type domain-containing protein n=1 Tax=Portunus trituberculatus TaxID=210409 RepID=A0A5B7DA06_PORTR|nr:hypothetical protein [Portunus trituberculatus]
MGVPRSTVSTIWKNRDKYHETAASVFVSKNVLCSTLCLIKKKLYINEAINSTDLV